MSAVCGFCDGEATIPLALSWACPPCWDRVFGDARARYIVEIGGIGVMRQAGVMRPDHGPHYAECACCVCEYEAVAVIGAPCAACECWLARAIERDERRREKAAAA